MNKKNIWIFNQYVTHPKFPGGTRHIDIGKELINKGYNVHIFASGFHYSLLKELILHKNEKYKIENIGGIIVHWLKILPYKANNFKRFFSMLSFYFALLKEVSRYKKDKEFVEPDIIIGSSVHLLTVLAAYKTAKKLRGNFIMEVRDLWPSTLIESGKLPKFHPIIILFSFLEKFLYKKAYCIISLLGNAYKYIEKYTHNKKIVHIPNSFNTDLLKTINNNSNIYNSDKFKIMYAGAIGIPNNVITLLKAFEKFKELNNIQLIIIGEGKEKDNIISYVKNKNLSNIIFKAPVPKIEVLNHLKQADILWAGWTRMKIANEYGISHNKLFDYMSVKKPIILSTPSEDNVIKSSNCGYSIEAENSEELAEKIKELYKLNKDERESMGLRGYNYLMKYYTTKKIVEKLIKQVIE